MLKLKPLHKKLDYRLRRMEREMLVQVRAWLNWTSDSLKKGLLHIAKVELDPEDLIDWDVIESRGNSILNPAFLKVYTSGKKSAYETVGLGISFDVLEPAAVSAATKLCAKLVKEVSEETKKAIQQYIADGIEEGLSNQDIARNLKDVVGLTARQAQAINNYRKALIEEHPEIGSKELRSKLIQYRTTAYNRRLTTIARTETARAQTSGYVTGLDALDIHEFEFSTYPGHCEICHDLEGKHYVSENAGEVIPIHPNCRCVLLPVVPKE